MPTAEEMLIRIEGGMGTAASGGPGPVRSFRCRSAGLYWVAMIRPVAYVETSVFVAYFDRRPDPQSVAKRFWTRRIGGQGRAAS